MGQKTNPISNRIGITRGWDSNWCGGNYAAKIAEDYQIRKYLVSRLAKAGLSKKDTDNICSSVYLVRVFEKTAEVTGDAKESAKWVLGELMKLLNDTSTLPENMHFAPESLGKVILMLKGGKISRDSAKKTFEAVFTDDVDPEAYVKENNMGLMNDTGAIRDAVAEVLANNEKAVNEYKGGKEASFNFLVGQSMRALRGKAPAAEVTKILKELLG